jgi:hypothetical protein
MNTKTFLIPFIAVLAVLMVGFTSAGLTSGNPSVTFNDVVLGSGVTMAGATGETVPIRVSFVANKDAEDVKVKVWMDGFRDEVFDSTSRFSIISGSTYSKLLSIRLPTDLKQLSKVFTLKVSVVNADDETQTTYSVKVQREDYITDVLSVDYNSKVSAGETFPVTIVIKNVGMQDLDDGYVIVSIPSLGIATRSYFGDLAAIENCSNDCDKEDSVQRIVSLKVPESVQAGLYELVVRVYNKDSTRTVSKTISIEDSASTSLIAVTKSQDIKIGETKKFDLIVVNSGKGIRVYNIQAVLGAGLSVSVPSIITVSSDSSATIPVSATVLDNADLGAHPFSVEVNGQKVSLTANVVAGSASKSVSTSVLALTVILVIIFVVLLIVLIVLMTRKDKQPDQVETSYY